MGLHDAGIGRSATGPRTASIHLRPPRIGGEPGACGCGGDCGGVGSAAGCGCKSCAKPQQYARRLPLRFSPSWPGWSSLNNKPVTLPSGWRQAGEPWETPVITMKAPFLGTPGRAGPSLSVQLQAPDAQSSRLASPMVDGLRRQTAARGRGQGVRSAGLSGVVREPTAHPFGLAWSNQHEDADVVADEVYIYLSAGPRDDATGVACTPSNTQTCSLWRIHWNFTENRAVEVLRVREALAPLDGRDCPDWLGFADPAATTLGRVAYVERCHTPSGAAAWASIIAEDVGGKRVIAFDGKPDRVAAYPAWFAEGILFNQSDKWVSTLWATGPWPFFSSTVAYLGPDSTTARDVSFSDPNVVADGESGGGRIVAFGGACDTDGSGVCDATDAVDTVEPWGVFDEDDVRALGWERIPRTFPLFYGSYSQAGLPVVDGYDEVGNAIMFSECHHPAWRPDGQAFLCTRYDTAERMSEDETGCEVRRLYSFGYADGYVNPTALIDVPSREEIRKIPKWVNGDVIADHGAGTDLFMVRLGRGDAFEGCEAYVWKFAEWCGSSDWVVGTLYCTDNTSDTHTVRRSRVVLIDLRPASDTSSADAYVDLTSWIEFKMKVTPGSFDGTFSSCGSVPVY